MYQEDKISVLEQFNDSLIALMLLEPQFQALMDAHPDDDHIIKAYEYLEKAIFSVGSAVNEIRQTALVKES